MSVRLLKAAERKQKNKVMRNFFFFFPEEVVGLFLITHDLQQLKCGEQGRICA